MIGNANPVVDPCAQAQGAVLYIVHAYYRALEIDIHVGYFWRDRGVRPLKNVILGILLTLSPPGEECVCKALQFWSQHGMMNIPLKRELIRWWTISSTIFKTLVVLNKSTRYPSNRWIKSNVQSAMPNPIICREVRQYATCMTKTALVMIEVTKPNFIDHDVTVVGRWRVPKEPEI